MKLIKHWVFTLVLMTMPALAEPPGRSAARTDINPALLYWQAFSAAPDNPKGSGVRLGMEWVTETPSAAEIAFAARYDRAFELLRRAAAMEMACDWGADPADGPDTAMPNAITIRQLIQVGVLRARVALDAGRMADARDDLLAGLAMARHSATDGCLVSVMIQTACEDLLLTFIGGHYGRFPTPVLREIAAGFGREPKRTSVQAAMTMERQTFFDWFVHRIEASQAENPQDESKALQACQKLMNDMFNKFPDTLLKESGGTIKGLLAYCKQLDPLYDQLGKVATASPEHLSEAGLGLAAAIESSSNLIAQVIFPNIQKARTREIEVLERLSMLQAAVAYRAEGATGLRRVDDPFGTGPFELENSSNPNRPGFELRSPTLKYGFKSTLFFAE